MLKHNKKKFCQFNLLSFQNELNMSGEKQRGNESFISI